MTTDPFGQRAGSAAVWAVGLALAVGAVLAAAPGGSAPGAGAYRSGATRPGKGEAGKPRSLLDFSPESARPADVDARRGASIYAVRCAACHGAEGKADGKFAAELDPPPRSFKTQSLRLVAGAGGASPEDLYRTISQGVPGTAMPSFDFLAPADRWALIAFLRELRPELVEDGRAPVALPPRPESVDLFRGQQRYAQWKCAGCHGAKGGGKGKLAAEIKDDLDRVSYPRAFADGTRYFKGGENLADVARIIATGLPGTPMAGFGFALEDPEAGQDLWHLAEYVLGLVRAGASRTAEAETAFAKGLREKQTGDAGKPVAEAYAERFHPGRIGRTMLPAPPDPERGCLVCHEGVEEASDNVRMNEALLAFGGGSRGRACAVCHEGSPDAGDMDAAHAGLIANPGSLWAVGRGLGCGKCHSGKGVLTSLMGRPLPEPAGGSLMSVRSLLNDPTGASGADQAYRLQRSVMNLEIGKVTHTLSSGGLIAVGEFRYADFDIDDPDGLVPLAGTPAYRDWVARAHAARWLPAIRFLEEIPGGEAGRRRWPDPAQSALADFFRKDCARCHGWGPGKGADGEMRGDGCTGCHVMYENDGLYRGQDLTIPKDEAGHPALHGVTAKVPPKQCNHCHTRGFWDYDAEVHLDRGMTCSDCHSSIEVHGDGNIYGTIPHQREVECEDCHGTETAWPWDLPLGGSTPVQGEGPRGTWRAPEISDAGAGARAEHLLTSRGNPRTRWLRLSGNRAAVRGLISGKLHEVPMLRRDPSEPGKGGPRDLPPPKGPHADPVKNGAAAHNRELTCSSCHSAKTFECSSCHMSYDPKLEAVDWVASARNIDFGDGSMRGASRGHFRPQPLSTPGGWTLWQDQDLHFGQPAMERDIRGRIAPRIPACRVAFERVVGENDSVYLPVLHGNSWLGPTVPHENSSKPRDCKDCHRDGIPEPRQR